MEGHDGTARTPREKTFRQVCLHYLSRGIVPTVRLLKHEGFGNGRTIRGNYVAIRTRLLVEYGYEKNSRDRWQKK